MVLRKARLESSVYLANKVRELGALQLRELLQEVLLGKEVVVLQLHLARVVVAALLPVVHHGALLEVRRLPRRAKLRRHEPRVVVEPVRGVPNHSLDSRESLPEHPADNPSFFLNENDMYAYNILLDR